MQPNQQAAVWTWIRLIRVANKIGRVSLEHLRSWDLSLAQFDVIMRLGTAEKMTQRELAGHLRVTEGDISQLLTKLEQRGLIARDTEGRCKQVRLTEAGQALRTQLRPEHEAVLAAQFDTLTADEVTQLSRLLRKLDHHQN